MQLWFSEIMEIIDAQVHMKIQSVQIIDAQGDEFK